MRTLPTLLLLAIASTVGARPLAAETASEILKATGVSGGLIVHLGCGDGELTAALRANDRYLVHGLDTDPAQVRAARERIQALGIYGPVAVDTFDGRQLPYIDNYANLIVVQQPCKVPAAELLRVLVPNGVLYRQQDGEWKRTVKPRPAEIDDWTHYLHDSTNNAVAARHGGRPAAAPAVDRQSRDTPASTITCPRPARWSRPTGGCSTSSTTPRRSRSSCRPIGG